jgi:glutamate dehydrogenase
MPKKSTNNTLDYKNKLKNEILNLSKNNTLLTQFCSCYITSLNTKSLHKYTSETLFEFLKTQFNYLVTFFEKKENYLLDIKNTSHRSITVTIICPDVQYLIFTLENLFKQFNLTITRMNHPLVSVYKNQKKEITFIDLPKKDSKLFSCCSIECQFENSKLELNKLEQELKYRLNAALCISKDSNQMMKNLIFVQHDVSKTPTHFPEFQKEWIELLDWLTNENFSCFGYGEFLITKTGTSHLIKLNESESLGLLSKTYLNHSNSTLVSQIKNQIKNLMDYRSPFIFDSLKYKSPIKRFENLMRINLKIPTGPNKWIQYNFIGLLKRSSLLAKNTETPIIKLKIKTILERKQIWPGSHNYYQTIRLLNNVPKIELFKTPIENLQEIIENLLSITNPNDISFFKLKQIDKSKLFVMGVIPNSVFSNSNLIKIINYLEKEIPNSGIEYFVIPSEQFVRIHIYFDQEKTNEFNIDLNKIESTVIELIQPWEKRFHQILINNFGIKKSDTLYTKYVHSFPEHYKIRRSPRDAIIDVDYFESSTINKKTEFNLVPFKFKDSLLTGKANLLNIYHYEKIDLFQFIPIFQNLNIYFFDELTTRVGSINSIIGYIHAFRIKFIESSHYTPQFESFKDRLIHLLNAIFQNKLPNDPINGLISCTELNWKDIFILQGYRNYLLQLRPNYTKEKINTTILKHKHPIELIIKYFKTKFTYTNNHTPSKKQINQCLTLKEAFLDSLSSVSDIDEDYILKWIFNLIEHTLRTNYFKHELETSNLLSLKLDGEKIIAPLPKSFKEIFIFDPEVEGIHIRFGAVSRGGIRWSSRPNDYRSEVLGLAKTQRVKNVVIIPNGSKGGFVIKKKFEKSNTPTESKNQYEKFIEGLISLTDNVDNKNNIIKPEKTICYDTDDPYLVVAADKGTATFSDFANNISTTNNFWLDDAFASGGSAGFNHKELGITAKGAWECVKLHFLEIGKDINKTPFTCVGIGDMSGDVFGNGMLLSKQTKLIAAFNHLHIFIDPTPDAKISWEERNRLFNLPKSTWEDYNKKLLSTGGGIYSRYSKKITLSNEIKKLLNLEQNELNGSELIHALLQCKVELLWFGGIGTYIKSENQSHSSVGDLANDSVRINDSQCKAKVIGEGANLGITQQARLKLSENSIHLNTDFIDNSAGVNISDYEVNLKIFLQKLLQKKHIKTTKDRNSLLKKSTKNVIENVLKNNIYQHKLLSMEEIRSKISISPYTNLITHFINEKKLNPQTDIIPSQEKFEELDKKKMSLPRPLLALLQSLIKLDINGTLLEKFNSKDPFLNNFFYNYFPKSVIEKFKKELNNHQLKHEIIITELTNYIINNAGVLFFRSTQEITGKSIKEITETYLILDKTLNYQSHRKELLKQQIPLSEKYKQLIKLESQLKYIIIDALLIPNSKFNIENFSNIQKLYTTFLSNFNPNTLSNTTIELNRFFIPYYTILTTLKKPHTKTTLNSIEKIYSYFSFDFILMALNQTILNSNWEVEQIKLLYKILSQKKITIINKVLTTKPNKDTLSSDKIQSFFSTDLNSFNNLILEVKSIETVSLSALTVIINKLNLL